MNTQEFMTEQPLSLFISKTLMFAVIENQLKAILHTVEVFYLDVTPLLSQFCSVRDMKNDVQNHSKKFEKGTKT